MPGRGFGGIAFPLTLITAGVVLLLHQLGYIRGDIWKYWPVLLIVLGVGMIFAARRG
jgi:hypothetical protein